MKKIVFWGIIFIIFFLNNPASNAGSRNYIPKVSVWISINPQTHSLSGKSAISLPQGKVTWVKVKNLNLQKVLLGKRLIRPEIENGRFRVLSVGKNQRLEVYFRGYFPPKAFCPHRRIYFQKRRAFTGHLVSGPGRSGYL